MNFKVRSASEEEEVAKHLQCSHKCMQSYTGKLQVL